MVKIERKKVWQMHYPEEIPTSISYDEMTLDIFLHESGKHNSEMKELNSMGKEITFSEQYTEVRKLAHYMQSLAVEKGARVAIMLPNCPQAVISYYATLLAGGIVVQTNPLYTERELKYQMNDSGATFIVCLDIL